LRPVDILLTDNSGAPIANATVTATKTPPAPASCATAADGNLTLGVTDGSGHLGALLPNGYWQIATLGATTNLNVTDAPASINLETS
jgi:hypothetical protein